jgi:hypothetical protein
VTSLAAANSARWKLPVAAVALVAVGAGGGYFWLNSQSSDNASPPPPVVHHAPHPSTAATAAQTAAAKAAAARTLMDKALAAARASGSYQWHDVSTDKQGPSTTDGWSGKTTSEELTDFGSAGTMVLRMVGPAFYVVGDAAAMRSQYDLSGDDVTYMADRWLEVAKGDPGYDDAVLGGTAPSQLAQLDFDGTMTQLPETVINGQRAIPLRGKPAKVGKPGPHAVATIYVAATGTPVILQADEKDGDESDVITFSNWGSQRVVISPPTAVDEAWLVNAAAADTQPPPVTT